MSLLYYNNPKLYKTDHERTEHGELKDIPRGPDSSFKKALLEAELYYDKQTGVGIHQRNGGSLPFHKMSVNSYHPDFPSDLKKKIKKDIAEVCDPDCHCYKRGESCDSGSCENRSIQVRKNSFLKN